MSSVGYHEPIEELSAETRDMHRAIVSLRDVNHRFADELV